MSLNSIFWYTVCFPLCSSMCLYYIFFVIFFLRIRLLRIFNKASETEFLLIGLKQMIPYYRCGSSTYWTAFVIIGRPSHTWLRAIETDLGPLNFGLTTAWRKATTRDEWRHIVDIATVQWSVL